MIKIRTKQSISTIPIFIRKVKEKNVITTQKKIHLAQMTGFFSLYDKLGQNNPILSSILSTIYIYVCIHPIEFIASLEEQEKTNTHNERKKKKEME